MSVSEMSPGQKMAVLTGTAPSREEGGPPITRKMPKLEAFAPLMRQKKLTGLNRSSQAYQPQEQSSGQLNTYKVV